MTQTGEKLAIIRGGCTCGAIGYVVEDAFLYAANCHCSLCRKATGSAFKAFAGITRDKLEVVAGEDNLMIVGGPDAFDLRCARCGAFLVSVIGERVHVAMGSLIDAPSIRPSHHIFVGSKAPWHTITDDLPQYPEFAP